VENARYARVFHSRQWSNYDLTYRIGAGRSERHRFDVSFVTLLSGWTCPPIDGSEFDEPFQNLTELTKTSSKLVRTISITQTRRSEESFTRIFHRGHACTCIKIFCLLIVGYVYCTVPQKAVEVARMEQKVDGSLIRKRYYIGLIIQVIIHELVVAASRVI